MQNVGGSMPATSLNQGVFLDTRRPAAGQETGVIRPKAGQREDLKDSLIMMVDDEPINLEVVQSYLEVYGYCNSIATHDSTQAIKLALRHNPHLILLDLMMPQVSGFDILSMIQNDSRLSRTPVVVLTASSDSETRLRALELGASDFLHKPVDPSELVLRLQNTLSAKAYQDYLASYSATLEQQVRVRTEQLESAQRQIIHCLARAAEFRDTDSGQHVLRVGRYAATIARQLGLDPGFVERIQVAAQLHDVGKIGVPDSILLDPRSVDLEEYQLPSSSPGTGEGDEEARQAMARHTEIGATIMGIPETPVMKMAAVIAQTHHERWDGSGYPRGLGGKEIPIEGRISALADVFDTLTTKRPNREPLSLEEALSLVKNEREKHFDPQVVDAFLAACDEVQRIHAELADGK